VIWLIRSDDTEHRYRIKLSYRFFGGHVGEPLPSLDGFHVTKHTKRNAMGKRLDRPNIRDVPKAAFGKDLSIAELVKHLFGLQDPAVGSALLRQAEQVSEPTSIAAGA
jgi:hypothetical protein